MIFAEKLKELRMQSGQSLQQVADAVGASKAHVWQLETGKSKNPTIGMLASLADNFHVSVAFLIGETPGSSNEDDELMAIYRDLKCLTKNDRDTVRMLIKGFKEREKEGRSDKF